ncbi:Predicted NTP pyrophosphohydrolase, NUDIX family [Leifsonia sp. 98AMF]|uniref:NUDIX domain-containing protein n=1 Tax=unclassified Leifsonia TaxID=2663824 RepID=UPI00087A0CFC|nr:MULTISPECIES: NUDIX domain-containing protein [unclassified Leifsonia]SDH33088.1 Predicted NTP pyrophosphohydrolase, NUDIX family [Leifsonia sp. 197AMF]SDJ01887.1 Predicted NTP pyrophosphohydrolase, NUDIX family [Leifsonia sp. 466MF]SDJ71526.1 Predicted NTP pyrophosphohydrolase, NUDIX family [Leifsonia sp. 157MF]SDO05592.1 Predicted NTP pyrophosphohydrolase, NUDIX family [Leifsonia sp. 509MF]SEM98450.1 Predicted NTP pyrophosphohydrolase, NUDIX family [Leifsonia sp. 467MF]
MPARSAALLLYRRRAAVEVWIAHMGGPFWARKDEGAWSLPKGIVESDDLGDELAAARREFAEEMGSPAPDADYVPLGEFRGSGKTIVVFAAESEFEPDAIDSNTFELEWPPRSGRMQEFPEIDDARWFSVDDARLKLTKAQRPILDTLLARLEEDAEIH